MFAALVLAGIIAALAVASLVWLPVTRRWNARAYLCWSSTIFLFVVYLAFVLDWTLISHLGADARWRAPVYQPARPRAQRAARHGHRHAAVPAAARLPAV